MCQKPISRCELAHRHRERLDVVGPVGAGQGIPVDLETSLPTDGSSGRTEHSGHCLREEEQGARLLSQLAQVEDSEDRRA